MHLASILIITYIFIRYYKTLSGYKSRIGLEGHVNICSNLSKIFASYKNLVNICFI